LASAAWIAVWWTTRAVPIPVASLLPLVLFPVLGVADLSEAAAPYADPTVCLLLGGSLVTLAGERWNLQRRLALGAIALLGASPGRLVLGFLTLTAILSLWLSTAVTALIVLPLGLALIAQVSALQKYHAHKVVAIGGGASKPAFGIALVLGIAYAAAFGGIGNRIGSPSAFHWLLVAVPAMLLVVACGWFILRAVWGLDLKAIPGGKERVGQELNALGPATRPEQWSRVVFAAVSIMWITRPFLIAPYLPQVDDAVIAVAGALALSLIPANLSQNRWLLSADTVQRVPWGILLLFGAGFSIARAGLSSGLAEWLTGSLPPALVAFGTTAGAATLGLIAIGAVAASFMSNVSYRQSARAAAWLGIAGMLIATCFTYVWPGV
jgi:sodium-dependent dicarboxylate transporter 2/3/5